MQREPTVREAITFVQLERSKFPVKPINMALRYILSFAVLSAFFNSSAQGLVTLFDEEENVVNGTVITRPCRTSSLRDTVSLATVVVGTADRDISVRRYEVWTVDGSSNMFCWGVCYSSAPSGTHSVWTSPHPETLSEDEYFTGFHAYYEPNGMPGTARFRYVFYDEANPNGPDSSWVDIDYCSTVGISESATRSAELIVTPNPSAGSSIVLDYTLGDLGQGTEVTLYNVLGEKVRRQALTTAQGRVTISSADLRNGVYFANIVRNGRMLATRRVVVSH